MLFHPNTVIESIDQPNSNTEAACCYVKLWTSNPSGFAKEGSLCLPKSIRRGTQHHSKDQPARSLAHEVILHVNYILDYRPPRTTTIPWPRHYRWDWVLGIRDDHTLPTRRRELDAWVEANQC